ncbi:MAG: iron ABC transporter permease [Cyanobacteria bacterium SIG32]|nr:iron ABC transporter permease [Cyanobacteria bacterium SIG32]
MNNIKNITTLAILIILFISALCCTLFYNLPHENSSLILEFIRIPNTTKAIIAGASLALAGMILQAVTKNPLADPYLTGLSSGAGLGITLSILYFHSINYSLFGFIGALLTSVLVICLSGFSKFSISKLILIGLSVNILASSIIAFLILTNAEKAYALTLILSGGFSSADISKSLLTTLFTIALIICIILIPKLNLFRIDSALTFNSLNKVLKYNIIFIMLSAFLTSIAVFTAGILGFIGIIVPHLSKILVGNDFRILIFANFLLGGLILLISNFISTNLIAPIQIPLGIVIAFIGVPIFIFFLLRRDFE